MRVVLGHWSVGPALPLLALGLALYALGEHRRRRAACRAGHRRRRTAVEALRPAAYCGGLVALALALYSPVDYWADRYLLAHMLQHLLLGFVAPPLLVLGAPWLPVWRGLPRPARLGVARLAQRARRSAPWRRLLRGLTHPVVVFVLFNASMVVWHLPGPFDLAYRNQTVHVLLEHTTLFLFGMLLWSHLLDSPPLRPRWSPLVREAAALGTNAVMVGVAMTLVLFSHRLYPVYASGQHLLFSQAADQQVAGGTLWVCGEFTLAPTIYWNVVRWLRSQAGGAVRVVGAGVDTGVEAAVDTAGGPWVRRARRWHSPSAEAVEMGWRSRSRGRARDSVPQ